MENKCRDLDYVVIVIKFIQIQIRVLTSVPLSWEGI